MATGNARFGESTEGGSDEYHAFSCSPCHHETKHVQAVKYCTECEEYLCAQCLSHHNRLAKLRSHVMLDEQQMSKGDPTQHVQHALPLFLEKCSRHHGHLMDMFCETHDIVCCHVCSTLEHGSCQMKYLPDVAIGTKDGAEIADFTNSLKRLHQTMTTLKQQREADLKKLEKQRKEALDDIRKVKENLLAHIDRLETAMRDEINAEYEKQKQDLCDQIETVSDEVKVLEDKLKKLDNSRNDIEAFFGMKTGQEVSKLANNIVQDVGMAKQKYVAFEVSSNIADFLSKTKKFGSLKQCKQASPDQLYSISFLDKYVVSANSDTRKLFDIADSCLLSDHTVLLVDWENLCIKRLHTNYKVLAVVHLPSKPGAIAELNYEIAAVSLQWEKRIQFITLTGKMTTSTSFKIKEPCRGIVCKYNQLYLSCGGGSGGGKFTEAVGQILVYSDSGNLLRCFMTDQLGQQILGSPRRILINNVTSNIHVCDNKKGLVTLDSQGNWLWSLTTDDFTDCTGIAQDDLGQLFVCSFQSDSVLLINRDGNKKLGNTLLKGNHGVVVPKSLCYDGVKKRLLVTKQESNDIRVFSLTHI